MTAALGAQSLASADRRYALVLPGNWASIPMDDPDRLKERVRALVKQQVPRDDRFATARRNIREELLGNATRARDAGATLYALSLELLPGLPFPASLIAYDLDWPPSAAAAEDAVARLAAAFPGAVEVPTAPVPSMRQATVGTRRSGDVETTVLDLAYWFADPTGRLVCVLVSVPDCPAVELVTELFDMIASSIHWAGDPATAHDAPAPESAASAAEGAASAHAAPARERS